MTLGNFFKTSHFKSCDSFEKLVTLKVVTLLKTSHLKVVTFANSSKTSHFKNRDSWQFIFQNHSLVIDYHYSVIDYTSTDVTLHV